MFFAIITLLTAFALAGVAAWFSIIGVMAILAGAPFHALVAGATIEVAKLVTTSWIYRNWEHASLKLRSLLIFFTLLIMLVTSMGVFGFLSKAHLEQGASTIDNSAKVVRLEEQIAQEKSSIADNQKVIGQLDQTVQSLTDAQRIRGRNGSIAVRKSQEEQRKQLRDEIDASQKRIDALSEERFTLQSEVRKLELEVGPIRYIAELIYGAEDNSNKHIESAVRIFILLLVLTLDPLAVTLLIAANNTILRLQNAKKENSLRDPGHNTISVVGESDSTETKDTVVAPGIKNNEVVSSDTIYKENLSTHETESFAKVDDEIYEEVELDEEEKNPVPDSTPTYEAYKGEEFEPDENFYDILHRTQQEKSDTTAPPEATEAVPEVHWTKSPDMVITEPLPKNPMPIVRSPRVSRVEPLMHRVQQTHFTPQKLNEEDKDKELQTETEEFSSEATEKESVGQKAQEITKMVEEGSKQTANKKDISGNVDWFPSSNYPNTLSWLKEFRRLK